MGCITKGHSVVCADRNRRGGIKRIWLSELDSVTMGDFAIDSATGTIDQMTSDAAYEFEFERETAGFNANATREDGSTKVDVELEFYVPKLTSEINQRLDELACACGVVAVIETFADDGESTPQTYFFVLGWDNIFTKDAYLEFTSGEMQTGLALQDANGTLVKLAGVHGEYPRELKMDPAGDVVEGIYTSNAPASGYINIAWNDASLTNNKWRVRYGA